MLTIIDTKAGNFNSVTNAILHIGGDIEVTDDIQKISNAKALVLPGVAAFGQGISSLRDSGLIDIIKNKALKEKKPIIGICLGMQLLASSSDEYGTHEGLGLIEGNVTKLTSSSSNYKVPNIGWCDVTPKKQSKLLTNNSESFYHVHSYHLTCKDKQDVAGTITYDGKEITVAIEKNNIFGVQFHPEKSQDAGLNLLERFLAYTKEVA